MKAFRAPVLWIAALLLTAGLVGCGKNSEPNAGNADTAAAGQPAPPDKGAPTNGGPGPDGGPQPVVGPDGDPGAEQGPLEGHLVRLKFSTGDRVNYQVRTKLQMSETAEGASPQTTDVDTNLRLVENMARSGDNYDCSMRYENISATLTTNGQKDPDRAKQFIEEMKGRTDVLRFDPLGRLQYEPGEEAGLDVGFGGMVFSEKPVKAGDSWTYSTSLNLAGLLAPGLAPVSVKATYRLVEVKARDGITLGRIKMKLNGSIDASSSVGGGVDYTGSVELTGDAWVDLSTGIVDSASSELVIKASAVQEKHLTSLTRYAKETRTRER